MSRKFLDNVYEHIGDGVESFYDKWAATYENEVGENGYVTPTRCAKALSSLMSDRSAPVLDFGCGTGLSGLALRAEGLSVLDGMDLSEQMLAQARDKGVYRTLTQVSADEDLPVSGGDYAAVAAIGVIGPGAAPLEVFDTLIGLLSSGGLFVFSFNDHALEDPAYAAKVDATCAGTDFALKFKEHGAHLPARNIHSTVYVIEKQ